MKNNKFIDPSIIKTSFFHFFFSIISSHSRMLLHETIIGARRAGVCVAGSSASSEVKTDFIDWPQFVS